MDTDMTEAEASTLLQAGAAILNEVLAPYGFTLGSPASGTGSGGSYATCQFSRGDRRLRLHFRYSLGLVEYEVGAVVLPHEEYIGPLPESAGQRGIQDFQTIRLTASDTWPVI